jgi:hypothetical protein
METLNDLLSALTAGRERPIDGHVNTGLPPRLQGSRCRPILAQKARKSTCSPVVPHSGPYRCRTNVDRSQGPSSTSGGKLQKQWSHQDEFARDGPSQGELMDCVLVCELAPRCPPWASLFNADFIAHRSHRCRAMRDNQGSSIRARNGLGLAAYKAEPPRSWRGRPAKRA